MSKNSDKGLMLLALFIFSQFLSSCSGYDTKKEEEAANAIKQVNEGIEVQIRHGVEPEGAKRNFIAYDITGLQIDSTEIEAELTASAYALGINKNFTQAQKSKSPVLMLTFTRNYGEAEKSYQYNYLFKYLEEVASKMEVIDTMMNSFVSHSYTGVHKLFSDDVKERMNPEQSQQFFSDIDKKYGLVRDGILRGFVVNRKEKGEIFYAELIRDSINNQIQIELDNSHKITQITL